MFDVCVLGGGMIGATVALGLARQGKRVAIVEQSRPRAFAADQGPDIRVSAISQSSVQLLESLGAWEHIAGKRVHSYSRLATWETPASYTEFDAHDIDRPRLGYFVENRILQLGVYDALATCDNVEWYFDCAPQALSASEGWVALDSGQRIEASVLIGADGGQSKARDLAGLGTQGWQYAQHAMGILIRVPNADKSLTWQQFTPSGPLAFLPMYDDFASLVWYDDPETINRLKSHTAAQLHQAVVAHFPDRLGEFEVLQSAAFPLTRMHANHYAKDRLILVGDAIHTINPLAGQGVNLGFKDVECLLALMAEPCEDLPDIRALGKVYEGKRRPANLAMMSVMDGLYSAFSNDIAPLRHLRNIGLQLAQRSGPVKHRVMKYAMGL